MHDLPDTLGNVLDRYLNKHSDTMHTFISQTS